MKGLTQDALAEKADVSAQIISHAKLEKKAMRADTIIGVCGVLEISVDYLLFGNTLLNSKISQLSPKQHRCLEDIINSFLTALLQRRRYGHLLLGKNITDNAPAPADRRQPDNTRSGVRAQEMAGNR